jgi:uncharacterized protein (DUF1778 family)
MEMQKPVIGIRIEPEDLKAIDQKAKAENRSRSGFIVHILKAYLDKAKKEQK